MECPRCAAPMEEQTFDAHLGRAVGDRAPIDPALPLELARARREVEAAFSNEPQLSTWLRDAPAGDLLGASLIAMAKWLKRDA